MKMKKKKLENAQQCKSVRKGEEQNPRSGTTKERERENKKKT